MEQILPLLLNAGGMGVLAGALLWLHNNALGMFRAELREERQAFGSATAAVIGAFNEKTEQILSELAKLKDAIISLRGG